MGTGHDSRVVLRPATDADADAVAVAHHRGWTEAYRGLLPDAYLDSLSLPACRARWRAGLQGTLRVVVAEVDETVVGFVSYGPCADPDATAAGEVWDLWVLPGHRSAGVGGALLAAALDALATTHPVAVVWALAGNARGRAFYERAGGVRDGLSRRQPVPGGEMVDVRYLFDLRDRARR